ncbi:MAG: cobyric acid synthase CobQ, partial [Gammaproteobacteria bacterium]|nr:cobyric acid synthase CobQ [Gammaproteobacteria bacterium]
AMDTVMHAEKQLTRVTGKLALNDAAVEGYEIHMGISSGPALQQPAVRLDEKTDGAISPDNLIMGTYLHGLFDNQQACDTLLAWAGLKDVKTPDYRAMREQELDRLASIMEQHLDLESLLNIN